jgi:hypothetical protein
MTGMSSATSPDKTITRQTHAATPSRDFGSAAAVEVAEALPVSLSPGHTQLERWDPRAGRA